MLVAMGHIAKRLEGANPRINSTELENLLLELGLTQTLGHWNQDTDNKRIDTFYKEMVERTEALMQYVRDRKAKILPEPLKRPG